MRGYDDRLADNEPTRAQLEAQIATLEDEVERLTADLTCDYADLIAELTPAEVAGWLDDHPEHRAEVVGLVRRIGHWGATHGVVTLDHPLTGRPLAAACQGLDGDDWWSWWAGQKSDRAEGRCQTKREAQDAMCAEMVRRGWRTP